MFHNARTALPSYMELEAFNRALHNKQVKDVSLYIHELRWLKSTSELKLMRESASVACQVLFLLSWLLSLLKLITLSFYNYTFRL